MNFMSLEAETNLRFLTKLLLKKSLKSNYSLRTSGPKYTRGKIINDIRFYESVEFTTGLLVADATFCDFAVVKFLTVSAMSTCLILIPLLYSAREV